MIVPLRYKLRNGDIVEVMTNPNQRPSKDWLDFVVTHARARKIRNHLRQRAARQDRSSSGASCSRRSCTPSGMSLARSS